MPDYGHPLKFGSFITPRNDIPQLPVDLAILSEEVGLDVVTFQDHPYQPAFLDTATLLTWVAARTSRIHVSANVHSLPLRPAAVLARASASLDLLSGGRATLGLGTGGFGGPIAAMGGPDRTVGQAVSALDEAIDVIRGIWAGNDPTPLHMNGEYYQLKGAKRGPNPAHDLPIWVGAYKPRMLRLVGRKADGWLPSLPWLEMGVTRGNEIIDAAARGAGRAPRDIVRLLNVFPQTTTEELVRLAVEDGVSVFIVASDDPAEIRRFAQVVAPEVRERLEEHRARGASAGRGGRPVRSFGGDDVPESLAASTLAPGQTGYTRYTSGYFRGARPGLVLRPKTPAQVQDAVRFAARHRDVSLGILSGGHGLSGRSLNNDGIVIAVDALNSIEMLGAGHFRAGPGADWAEVARALTPHGLALTAGDYGGVGIGGLATAGGIGWFVREHGLTIDHLRSVDVVTADGALVRASADENPDLFWAMRGAGANFGIGVSFEFEAHPVGPSVGFAILTYAVDDVAGFFHDWGTTLESAHPSVTGTLMIAAGGRAAGRIAVQALLVVDSDDPDTVVERLQPFAQLAPLASQSVRLVPYSALLETPPGEQQQGRGEPHSHSALVRHLSEDVAAALAELLEGDAPFILSVRSAGGTSGNTASDATAYAWRSANFLIVTLGGRTPDFEARWRRVRDRAEGMYLSFETDTGPEVVARAFPPAHLERLRGLKRRWDPTGLFRDNFYIVPAED
jgi:alkanesulfonate monooxygenase SsuD/methylene tetrahydromethanopterin reductase-like flavin-dependent oxidoreductase (luciferase family)